MAASKQGGIGGSSADYLVPFDGWERGRSEAWLAPLRRAGRDRFAAVGLPGVGLEDWRFTPLSPLAKFPFRPALERPVRLPEPEVLASMTFGALPGHRLVFVDGHFAAELSRVGGLPPGVVVQAWSEQVAQGRLPLPAELGSRAPVEEDPFSALNAAYFTDGASIQVGAGVRVPEPVQLVHLSTAAEAGSAAHLRHLLRVEAGAQVTVIESYLSLTTAAHLTNSVTELEVGEGATVEHLKFQDENRAAVNVAMVAGEFAASSRAWLHSFALGARLSRTNMRTRLAGRDLECVLNGLYLTRADQLADHHMVVDHAAPHGASHEYFNGILDDRSRGVFHGRILVRPEAQKTDAKQTNKNLLLSDTAQVDAKPQLEIYADDVKCTHGATVGQLNEESIFYLRARGLGLDTARRMLIHAFAGEITERVQCDPAREELDGLLWDRLEQSPHLRSEEGA